MEINKPVSMLRVELIEKLSKDINECGLPIFVIEPIVKDLLSEIRMVMQQQYEEEKKQYEESYNDKE